MVRVIQFDNDFSPDELARALIDAGFSAHRSIGAIAAGTACDDDVSDSVTLDCSIDEDDALELLGDKAILRAARDIFDDGDTQAIEDGIRYVRAGEMALAEVMFARAFDGGAFQAVERALRQ